MPEAEMQCPKCNTENPVGAKFCLNCGAKLVAVCPQCGATLPPQAKFCLECGAQVGAPPLEARREREAAFTDALQRLVPKEFAQRLLATRGQVAKERRMVTILFSDVKGSTQMAENLDPEEWVEIMEGAFDVLIAPVYRHEGTLARLMGDAILAFFGAPIAHEDDPERACRAALEIIEGAQRYAARLEEERGIRGFNVRVGINTGLVVVGEVGSDLRVEYTAMGDAVNLAARMEQNAPPGGILISHDTYRHVRGVFDVLPQEPLTVKGKAAPVQTYLVQQAKPRAFRKETRGVEGIETRMIGREAELKRLQDAFYTAMEDGERQMVTISGEAGVGKSRLLHEFDLWSELLPERFYYFKGRASQEMRNLPYGLMRDVFAFRFQIRDSDPPPVVREKMERGIGEALDTGEESQMRAHFIGQLLGFQFGDSPHLRGILDDAQQIRDRALTYLGDYFKALAARLPVLILLEDLHWADDSSLDVLNHLALTTPKQRLLMVCTARPPLFERRPHWGEGQPFHTRLELQPLSKWDSRRLVAEILQKVDHVPDALRELVVSGAEGNPFYVEELIKMLIEDGVVVKGEGYWHVEPTRLTTVRVPPTLTGVLQARLDSLPSEERTTLQEASVVGRLFWDRAVLRISQSASEGMEETEILDNLSALRGKEMVFQRETSAFAGAQEYIFKHNMLREVTYEGVLKRLRRVYHGLVADWLMEQSGERVSEYTGLIADHLELAGRTVEAADYLIQAGDRARGLYAHQEAIGSYERALALLKEQGDYERAARTLMKLGLTYHNAFDFQQARQAYEEGFALWQRAGEAQPAVQPSPAPHALRVVWYPAPTTLDPTMAYDIFSVAVIDQLFSGLVELTPDMDAVPDVARNWEMLEDGRKYVFHLRDDVRWSDGAPVTAEDFWYGWKRVLDPATGSPNASLLYDVKGARAFHQGDASAPDSVGVRALGEFTLVVELEEPTGYFLHLLTHNATYPVPRHVVEAHGEAWTEPGNIVTNGPFRLEIWQRSESMVLVRNPEYHGRFRGNVQGMELPFGERLAGLEMYEADSLDIFFINHFTAAERDRARQRHAGEYVLVPEMGTFYVGFDVSRPPFDDPRVRQAFVLATDRETLADVVLRGYAAPALGGFIPPGMPGHSSGIGLPYDPGQARQLLAEAGYPDGYGFPIVEALTPHGELVFQSEYLQAQWRENLGVEITWKKVDWAKFHDRMSGETPHLWLMGWSADYPDPDNFLRASPIQRDTGWQNAAYDRLVEEAKKVADQRERMKLYQQADRILVEEAVIIPLIHKCFHLLVKPWVRKFLTSAIKYWFWKDVIIEPH
jgi:ABC-type oligopeptide transport system substrate-binding subunit/class 3 adenylate cyclase/ribosomal protein L40E